MEFSDLFDTFGHIVEKILSYVKDTSDAALTCKTFYKAICRNEKFKKILYISQRRIHHHFNSIINTGRLFNEMIVYNDEPRARGLDDDEREVSLEQIRKVSNQFGEDITTAEIHFTSWNTSHKFISFLNTMPHLTKLSMYDVHICANLKWEEHTLNLHKLKILTITGDVYVIHGFLNFLPDGVLRNVELPFGFYDYSYLFEHQRNIKKLKVSEFFEEDNFHNLKLQELSIKCENSPYLSTYDCESGLLKMLQPCLLKLEVENMIDQPIAVHICMKLKQLQSLSISVYDMTEREEVFPALVLNLSKLIHLKELKLRSSYLNITTLTLVQQPMITKLFLHIMDPDYNRMDIDAAGLTMLKQTFPSLIELGLKNVVPYNIPELLNVFADIETLSLRIFSYPESKGDLFEMTNEKSHERIKNFFIGFHHSNCDPIDIQFLKFVSIMSNLEELEIWNSEFFLNDVSGLNEALKKNLSKLKKLNVFKTDSYGIIDYPEKNSIVSQHMFH